jgi:hypothetical protein
MASTTAGAVQVVAESQSWLAQLECYLSDQMFPVTADEMLAVLIRRRAPSSLLRRFGDLPATHRFASVADIAASLSTRT